MVLKLKYGRFRDAAFVLLMEMGPLPTHEIVRRLRGFYTPTGIEASQVMSKDPRFIVVEKDSNVTRTAYGHNCVWNTNGEER